MKKALHPDEIAHATSLSGIDQTRYVASRWAVKEATLKAFGQRVLFPEVVLRSGNEQGTSSMFKAFLHLCLTL